MMAVMVLYMLFCVKNDLKNNQISILIMIMTFLKKILQIFYKSSPDIVFAENLYWQIVKISRNPKIYQKFKIPDTLDGRFDCLILHLFLVIQRLRELSCHQIANSLLTFFVKDMDRSLRETGVGDPSIARKMRKIGEAYMGRMKAYEESINDTHLLYSALNKNVYRNTNINQRNITLLTDYVVQYKQVLSRFKPFELLPNVIIE